MARVPLPLVPVPAAFRVHPARTGLVVLAATILTGAAGLTPARATTTFTPGAELARMTLAQRVGQLFMVGTPAGAASLAALSSIRSRHVGNVILAGRSAAGVTVTRRVSDSLQAQVSAASTAGVPLFVATDQEGGRVQVLSGPGYSTIPSALAQGRWAPSTVRADASYWGRQLRAGGVNVDLAPVLDTVPSAAAARTNPPIGWYDREYGFDPTTVALHGTAFGQGLGDGGVSAAVKHFPGLGRVTGNTDTTSGVTDRVTTRGDDYLRPFASAVAAGTPFVMLSTAYYSRIDPARPAAFSPTVIGTMLRGDLHFHGVVISDDLGNARQVAAWSPAQRALRFLGAGGDIVLTVNPTVLPQMVDAVLAQASSSTAFRGQVNAAALRVLTAKQQLVPTSTLPNPGYIDHVLQRGTVDPAQVWVLQTRLDQVGYDVQGVDGVFGPATYAAVRAYQSVPARRLTADGIVGPATGTALGIWR